MPTSARFHRVLPSDYDRLSPLADEVSDFLDAHVHDEDLAYRALLLVTEAVTNAMEHGNALDASKNVTLDVEAAPERVVVRVEDEGDGFDPARAPDAVEDGDPLSEGHRGLFLMRAYAQDVRFEQQGRRIVLTLARA